MLINWLLNHIFVVLRDCVINRGSRPQQRKVSKDAFLCLFSGKAFYQFSHIKV